MYRISAVCLHVLYSELGNSNLLSIGVLIKNVFSHRP